MPGEPCPYRHLRRVQQPVYDEMLIRAIREHTRLHRRSSPRAVRKILLSELPQHRLITLIRAAVNLIRIHILFQVVKSPELETGYPVHRKAVVLALIHYQVEHRKPLRREQLPAQRLKPRQNLPFGYRRFAQLRQQRRRPRPRRDNQLVRVILPSPRANPNPVRGGLPLQNALPNLRSSP